MIDLNDESFDQKESSVIIFNEGIPGIVENVTYSVSKRKPEEKSDAPDYKITFKDTKGGSVDLSIWYAKEKLTGDYPVSEVDAIKKQGKLLKHLIHAVYGKDFAFPSFSTKEEMLNNCMKLLMEGSKSGNKYRVFTNYGKPKNPSKYLSMRSWVPCMEPMTVPLEETRLEASNIENMVRLEADKPSKVASADSLLNTDDDWA